jgi:hypothetical protein
MVFAASGVCATRVVGSSSKRVRLSFLNACIIPGTPHNDQFLDMTYMTGYGPTIVVVQCGKVDSTGRSMHEPTNNPSSLGRIQHGVQHGCN